MPPGDHAKQAKPSTRVVVFHAPGAAPAKSLLAALERPGLRAVQVFHPWGVLAALLAPGAGVCVAVLHEPGMLPRVAEVLEAIAKYSSGTKIWIFDSGNTPTLRAATETDLALLRLGSAWAGSGAPAPPAAPTPAASAAAFISGSASPAVRTVSASPPALKLTDADPGVNTWIISPQAPVPVRAPSAPPSVPQTPPPAHAASAPLLSAEELEMLLSDDPEKCT